MALHSIFKPRKHRSPIGRMLDVAMLFLTLLMSGLLLLSYLSPGTHPEKAWFIPMLGFVTPVLYVANIIIALFWLMRWRGFIIIPLAVLLFGIGYVPLFFHPNMSREIPPKGEKTLTVISYNVMGFMYRDDRGKVISSIEKVAEFLDSMEADIICFQEFQTVSAGQKTRIDNAFRRHNVEHYTIEYPGAASWGIAIYSRFPIIRHGSIRFEDSSNSSMWADIVTGSDTVRVFNNHMQTTSVNGSDREYIDKQEFISDHAQREKRVKEILRKLRRNNNIRASQAHMVASAIESSPHPVVVCGDFNDPPMSYTYSTIRGDLADAFVEQGNDGIATNTFKGLFNMFRIDYVLYSPHSMKAVYYQTPDPGYSDHKPVVVMLEKRADAKK